MNPPEWKVCASCSRTLPLRRFTKDADKKDGRNSSCSLCIALRAARRLARNQGVPFSVCLHDLVWPLPERCPVLPWIKLEVGGGESSPSLDRIVPAKGYVPGNLRWISRRANTLKRDASPRELQALGRDGAMLAALEAAVEEDT